MQLSLTQIKNELDRTKINLEHERLEKEALQKELELLKEGQKQQSVNRQTFNESFDTIKDKINKSASKDKRSIGGIVEFD